ncbi:hypothetical protein ACFLQL_03090 [Verrucomicrobiota bacterium]
MKKRYGFVSNSSSASFVVHCDKISKLQKQLILDFAKTYESATDKESEDNWTVRFNEKDNVIYGFTAMNNEDEAHQLFDALELRTGAVEWEYDV